MSNGDLLLLRLLEGLGGDGGLKVAGTERLFANEAIKICIIP